MVPPKRDPKPASPTIHTFVVDDAQTEATFVVAAPLTLFHDVPS